MTFDDLATFVCSKVNQLDAYSFGVCKTFINRRYEMIHGTENWKDAMWTFNCVPINLGDPVLPYITDSEIERVTTIQITPPTGVPDRFSDTLESIDRQFIMETYPELAALDSAAWGKPKYYEEFQDVADGVQKIRLYPPPDKFYVFFIYGKKRFIPLSAGTDVPVLRNIDNCLISFVHGDMLQRQRQYAKAQDMFTEAAGQLDLMRKIETQISNLPRKSKAITVAGDSLAEMVDSVSMRIGDYSEPTQIQVREYMRRYYQDLYDSQLWLESLVMARVTRDGSEVILPEYIDRVIAVRGNSNLDALIPADQSVFFGVSPSIFEQSGSPINFSLLTSSSVAVLPVGTEQLEFVSADDSDKSDIFCRGEVGGVEVSEVVTLNGLTPVFSANLYDMPMTTAKQITRGDITVTGRVSLTFLVRLLAGERERKHIRLWLQPFPDDTIDGTECLVLGKRRIHPLVHDQDTPMLRGIASVLINKTVADWFTRIGNDKGAASAATSAKDSLDVMLDREAKQTANQPRIIPFNDGIGFGSDGFGDTCCGDL